MVRRGLQPVPATSVAVFRFAVGAVLAWSMARYLWRGWASTQLTDPVFRVHYPGFGWVAPLPAPWMHLVVAGVGLAGLALALGWRQRAAGALALVGFLWIELVDASTYLNHYELLTLLLGWAVVLPLSQAWSLDRRAGRVQGPPTVGRWVVWVLRAQLAVVYAFAGLAKVSPDWLLHGEPLATWLPARSDMAVIGPLLAHPWAGPVASWAGALFDLTIVGWLTWRRSRPVAYAAVLAFHGVTGALFPAIGVFPVAMAALTPVFFEPDWPERALRWLGTRLGVRAPLPTRASRPSLPCDPDDHSGSIAGTRAGSGPATRRRAAPGPRAVRLGIAALVAVLAVQVAVPLRHLVEPGDVRWDEVGYRWSWRVMVTERNGLATFEVVDPGSGAVERVSPADVLAPHQVRHVSSRPEALRQLAHWLADRREQETGARPEVHVTAWVSVNGTGRALLIDPAVDLASQPFELGRPRWVLPAPPDL